MTTKTVLLAKAMCEQSRKTIEGELPRKVIQGKDHQYMDKWERFNRLQKSLRPLRKGKHPKKGIYYGDDHIPRSQLKK